LIALLSALCATGVLWTPLLIVAAPLLTLALALPLAQAMLSAKNAVYPAETPRNGRIKLYLLTGFLHLLQPLARLRGRIKHGLTPWRDRGVRGFALPLPLRHSVWTGIWSSAEDIVARLHASLKRDSVMAVRGGSFDRWDLQVCGGWF